MLKYFHEQINDDDDDDADDDDDDDDDDNDDIMPEIFVQIR